jgi:hypothetical protein
MDYPITAEGFENREFTLRPGGFFKGARLWIDGQEVPKGLKRGFYSLKRNDGQEVLARFRGFLDPIPAVEIDGKITRVVEPLRWYQWVWGSWPVILLFLGGAIGGFLGGAAVAINAHLFRANVSPILKYFLTAAVSTAAVILFILIAGAFQLLIAKPTP